jgi:hypothetical protein
MKMQIIVAVLFLAVLVWTEPASAQKTYSVSVSRHSDVALTEEEVEKILDGASKLLQQNRGYKCNVAFTPQGPVRTFASPDKVFGGLDIDELHRVDADVAGVDFHVKVVKDIMFCRDTPANFRGCAYPPTYRSIIVVRPTKDNDGRDSFSEPVVWAHEFGHLTGLGHRKNKRALMKCGGVTDVSVRVSRRECRCILRGPGPGSCKLPPAPLWC